MTEPSASGRNRTIANAIDARDEPIDPVVTYPTDETAERAQQTEEEVQDSIRQGKNAGNDRQALPATTASNHP